MIVEEQCDNILKKCLLSSRAARMCEWEWQGRPKSEIVRKRMVKVHPGAIEMVEHLITPFKRVDSLIKEADAAECLLSNCAYIRECKKWFLGNLSEK